MLRDPITIVLALGFAHARAPELRIRQRLVVIYFPCFLHRIGFGVLRGPQPESRIIHQMKNTL